MFLRTVKLLYYDFYSCFKFFPAISLFKKKSFLIRTYISFFYVPVYDACEHLEARESVGSSGAWGLEWPLEEGKHSYPCCHLCFSTISFEKV